MKINQDAWHYRWYVFNYQLIEAFKGNDFFYEEPDDKKIGLCPYIRTLFIWGPMVMAFYAATISMIVIMLFLLPVTVYGPVGVAYLFGIIGTGLMIVIGLLFLSFKYQEYKDVKELEDEWQEDEWQEDEWQEDEDAPTPNTSFWTLVKEYIVSTKTKVCPILEIDNDRS